MTQAIFEERLRLKAHREMTAALRLRQCRNIPQAPLALIVTCPMQLTRVIGRSPKSVLAFGQYRNLVTSKDYGRIETFNRLFAAVIQRRRIEQNLYAG